MRSKPLILVALLLAAFAINLDTTMVNVALPSLVRELHATTTQLQWVVDAFNLVFAALLLTFGSLSDRFGRKGMLLAGLTVFGAASLAGGFTTSPAQLIAARAVMGLGAAMTFPATLSLISNVFTQRRERARAIGLWGAIAGVAIALGPIVGGWLLERFSWTSIFIAMAPVAAAAIALVAASVPGLEEPGVGAGGPRRAWCCRPRPWGCWSSPSSRRRTTAGPACAAWPGSPSPPCCWPRSSAGSGGSPTRCSTCGCSATCGSARPAAR